MSLSQTAQAAGAANSSAFARRGLIAAAPLYATALFLSALLLFSVQPMFTKMVLPYLGGSPGVWSVAMVFFQGVLLLGYIYAHCLTRYLPLRWAAAAHALVLIAAFAAMPIALAQGFGRPPADGAVGWLLGVFAVSVGLPFFAVSGNGPLLQAWFARCGHKDAADPYFLYGASNLGSFAALFSYPLLIEPWLTLAQQSRAWMLGFVALALLIGLCAALVWRAPATPHEGAAPAAPWPQRLGWTALAFTPSALLVAVTAHLGTDVAAAPFLWVIPLALFLLTFVLIFRARAAIPDAVMLRLQPASIAVLCLLFLFNGRLSASLTVVLHITAFFIAAMVCHAALYRQRPQSSQLTEFYVFMSLGGVLGGAFAALLAPLLFSTVAEYPLMLFAALLARPGCLTRPAEGWLREVGLTAAVSGAIIAPGLLFGANVQAGYLTAYAIAVAALAGAIILQAERPLRLAALAGAALAATHIYEPGLGARVYERSFFGVHKIVDWGGGEARVLFHGTTVHGAERLRGKDGAAALAGRPEQLTYYYPGGPFHEALEAARARLGGTFNRVALVGLGVGALACYGKPGEQWRFFEIDPAVARIATNRALFQTMHSCAPDADITIGDARLTLADDGGAFDLIIVDAFSSDVVPVHLLTQEAFRLYAGKLSPNGAIAMNISNRNIDLAPVVAASAAANGFAAYDKLEPREYSFAETYRTQAEIALIARATGAFDNTISVGNGWRRLQPDASVRIWTDDYSNIAGAIWRKYRAASAAPAAQ